jgi:hypothetical protein
MTPPTKERQRELEAAHRANPNAALSAHGPIPQIARKRRRILDRNYVSLPVPYARMLGGKGAMVEVEYRGNAVVITSSPSTCCTACGGTGSES